MKVLILNFIDDQIDYSKEYSDVVIQLLCNKFKFLQIKCYHEKYIKILFKKKNIKET